MALLSGRSERTRRTLAGFSFRRRVPAEGGPGLGSSAGNRSFSAVNRHSPDMRPGSPERDALLEKFRKSAEEGWGILETARVAHADRVYALQRLTQWQFRLNAPTAEALVSLLEELERQCPAPLPYLIQWIDQLLRAIHDLDEFPTSVRRRVRWGP
jgi:hypothetical protein